MAATSINSITPLYANDLAFGASLGSSADLVTAASLASTAIVHANTHEIAFPENGKMLVIVKNTTAGEKAVTFKAGDKIGASDSAVTLAQNQEIYVIPDASKHKNSSGKLVITVAASTTGNIRAVAIP